jgi:spore coat polysaccharide biosynthesis protein SpsF
MKVVAIIQARMGSTRLPGKVLADLAGEPMLARVVARTERAATVNQVVVAITGGAGDDVLVDLCDRRGWACFRGSEDDVLDRYYRAGVAYAADVVVRITADCPLIDPAVIDLTVTAFRNGQPEVDYAANVLPPRTFPRGLDTEVVCFDALARAWRDDDDPAWREHVTLYIHRHPELFRLRAVKAEVDHSDLRWTVDTAEDLAFVRLVYDHFGHDRFGMPDVLDVLGTHPEWLSINRDVSQKVV